MRKVVVILDPAHGAEVPGKRSPDGKHLEYKWSRDIVERLRKRLITQGFEVYQTTWDDKEPGIGARRRYADSIKVSPGQEKLLLSIHNDAKGMGLTWENARGVSVWTTKGSTKSDLYADEILLGIRDDFQKIKDFPPIRKYKRGIEGERDFESNFGVLLGSTYYGVLLEFLFQDNKEDVKLLSREDIKETLVDSLLYSIIKMDLTI